MNYYSYSYSYSSGSELSGGAIAVIVIGLVLLGLAVYALQAFFMMRLFKKAGIDGWRAWVPFYSQWLFLNLGGKPGWWMLLAFIPIVNIASVVMICIAAYNIGLKLDKDGAWLVLYILLGIIWLGIVGLDSSTWDGSKGDPSIGETASKANNVEPSTQTPPTS